MGCFSDIKFHGYFIGTLAGLLELASLSLSLYYYCTTPSSSSGSLSGGNDSTLPKDLQELVSTSYVDYTGDVLVLIAIVLMLFGIYKENRYCLIPFIVTICFDWICYVVHNLDRSLPYHVWLVTTAFFIYVLVAMIGLFVLFGWKINSDESGHLHQRFGKFSSDNIIV